MAILAYSILAYLWLVLSNAHAQFTANNYDACVVYNFTNGQVLKYEKIIKAQIEETDMRLTGNYEQIIKLTIGVGSNGFVDLSTHPEVLQEVTDKYGITIAYNPFNNYVELQVSLVVDRDGETFQNIDDKDVILFLVQCRDNTGWGMEFFEIQLTVNDANDNAPTFTQSSYSVSVLEATPISTTILDTMSATDFDINQNKDILFVITGGQSFNGVEYFKLSNPPLGYIMLDRPLDYEFLDSNNALEFSLTVEARDNATKIAERKTSTTTVTITVADSDDLTPTWYHEGCRKTSSLVDSCDGVIYKASITSGVNACGTIPVVPLVSGSENTETNLRAFDLDKLNAPIQFEIIATLPSGYKDHFSISTTKPTTDPNLPGRDIYTASLRQNTVINRNQIQEFELILKARQTDDPDKYREASVKFIVNPSNQNNPLTNTVRENVPVEANAAGNQSQQSRVTDADIIRMTEARLRLLEYKSIDMEASMLKHNLLFTGHLEAKSGDDCLSNVKMFLKTQLKMDTDNIKIIKAYRLDRTQTSRSLSMEDSSHREILASFSDPVDTDLIMENTFLLQNSSFGISRDYPREIREARKELWPAFEAAMQTYGKENVKLTFPASLVVNGNIIKNLFPDWCEVLRGSRNPNVWARIHENIARSGVASFVGMSSSQRVYSDIITEESNNAPKPKN